jgi:RHS repeat-associated protein
MLPKRGWRGGLADLYSRNADASAAEAGASPFAPPEVSLPKGGGAIKGIGEKFATNPVTGTGNLTVPIALSPGRSGFGPKLSLTYDSGAGNGPFGFGWRLSLPAITRKTDKGLPRYFDAEESDVFILSDAEDLVPTLLQTVEGWERDIGPRELNEQTYTVHRYRPRIEGLFARIERWRSDATGDTFWKTVSKDNVVSIFGSDASSRVANPDNPSEVFSWLLALSYDDRGNAILYCYKPENNSNVPSALYEQHRRITAKRYPKNIFYGNRTPFFPGNHNNLPNDWCFQAVFDYGEHDRDAPTPNEVKPWRCRPDPFSNYRACFEVRTYRLCSRVLMFHNFPDALPIPDCLVRSTDFHYSCDDTPPDPLSPNYTYLEAAAQSGYLWQPGGGTYLKRSIPPLEFAYSKTVIDPTLREADPSVLENVPAGVDGARYQWVDLDSEGSPGILSQQGDGWFYKRNVSNMPSRKGVREARFEPTELVASVPRSADLRAGDQQLMDIAGDGRLSLVKFARPFAGYHERHDDGRWGSFVSFASQPNIDWRDPNLRTVDLDGDGFADILITEQEVFTWYPSWARAGFGAAGTFRKPMDEDYGPAVVFADGTQSIYLADMSGDGFKDLVRVRNGEVCYWPNRGYGRFGAKITMDGSPVFDAPDQFDQKRVRLADIDGSGTNDLIYLGLDAVRVWLNQSGNSWSAPQALTEFPRTDELTSISTVDLLGNGTVCLVWSSPLPADVTRPLRYIDLMTKGKPHLLVNVRNNLGAETRIRYAASTKFYLADRAAGRPWVTRLAFPVHVVERVETYDWIGHNRFVALYTYHHGYFDGKEREFRGFGRVDQIDTEEIGALTATGDFPEAKNVSAASYVPPVLTKTWYHTGAYPMGRRVSRVYESEYFREPGLSAVEAQAMELSDTVLPSGLTGSEIREAIRSLKGSLLRQEVYALDGTPACALPYSVAEKNYTIRCLQPFAGNRHAVFFTHTRESVDFHYERSLYSIGGQQLADPRVTHAMVLAVDDYGNELQSVSIGYGRRYADPDPPLTAPDQTGQGTSLLAAKQGTSLLSYTENAYTAAIDSDAAYRTPLIAETQTFELVNVAILVTNPAITALFDPDDLASQVAEASDGMHDIPFEDVGASGATEPQPYRRLIADTRTYYRKDDLSACLPLGWMESMGLPFETYKLAFTPGLLTDVYQGSLAGGATQPLTPDISAIVFGVEPTQAGYVDLDGNGNAWIPSGQIRYSPDDTTPELTYAGAHFFLPCRFLDPFHRVATNPPQQMPPDLPQPIPAGPFEQVTVVSYDSDNLLPTGVVDAVGNQVTVGARIADGSVTNGNDYRVMQPALITDANGNRTAAGFDALGLVSVTAVMGALTDSPQLGDSLPTGGGDFSQSQIDAFYANPVSSAASMLGTATTCFIYDLHLFQRTRAANPDNGALWLPAFAAAIARETHCSDLQTGPSSQPSRLQIDFSHSDGFGREIQHKLLAEPGPLQPGGTARDPRWLGSGWTIFNNKGKPVRQYEPFFSATHDFEFEAIAGVSPILFYDPVGRVVATVHPNHAWEKVVFDPWREADWDVNDTVLPINDPSQDPDVGPYLERIPQSDFLPTWYSQNSAGTAQQQDAAGKASAHAATPSLAYFDTLGRAFLTVADNGKDSAGAETYFGTLANFDIQANQRSIVDALGRQIMTYDYDILGVRLHSNSVDAGERWTLNDVLGKPFMAWNSNGYQTRRTYDALRRQTGLYVEPLGSVEVLAEMLAYGDNMTAPTTGNLRGKIYQSFDAAGTVTNSAYDFKGNLLTASRQLLATFNSQVDWSQSPPMASPTELFTTSRTYDALNRPIMLTTPDGSVQSFGYNQTKLLQSVSANLGGASTPTVFVSDIDYDPKGQRSSIAYGNGVSSTYAYDPLTFRLIELTTSRPNPAPAAADLVQDLSYWYDPIGNITQIQDAAQSTLFFANQMVLAVSSYTYDPTYRLIKATGRELIGLASQPQTTWDDSARMGQPIPGPNDMQALRNYTETYAYDPVGNFQSLNHTWSGGGWTRTYAYDKNSPTPANNRLSSTTVTSLESPYCYDYDGNMTRMPHLPSMTWTFKDELQSTQTQVVNDGPAPTTYYVYDSAGQRVRKVNVTSSGTVANERIYLSNYEIYRDYGVGLNPASELQTLHIMDDKQHVAMVETPISDGSTLGSPLTRYQLSNHLGSSLVELDGTSTANIISYEEYYPYGSTSYQAFDSGPGFSAKRYRFISKERDRETALYYCGSRYYSAWIARWISCDPIALVDGTDVYVYSHDSPTRFGDPTGTASGDYVDELGTHYDFQPTTITGDRHSETTQTHSDSTHQASKDSTKGPGDDERFWPPGWHPGNALPDMFNNRNNFQHLMSPKPLTDIGLGEEWAAVSIMGGEMLGAGIARLLPRLPSAVQAFFARKAVQTTLHALAGALSAGGVVQGAVGRSLLSGEKLTTSEQVTSFLVGLYGLAALGSSLAERIRPLPAPGRVQGRINLMEGSQAKKEGWKHVLAEHYNPAKGGSSQFSVSQTELRALLQSPEVVHSPVIRDLPSARGWRYLREVTLAGRTIGVDVTANSPTSTFTIITDKYGNLITTFPGRLK